MNFKRLIAIFVFFTTITSVFSQTVIDIEPYTQDNIPSWAKSARRMSIVSLGSIPFTTLATTLGYTIYRYIANDFDADYIPSPFPTSSTAANLDNDEQVGILLTAAALGLVVGITDLIVVSIKENQEKKEVEEEQAERVIITPIISEGVDTE